MAEDLDEGLVGEVVEVALLLALDVGGSGKRAALEDAGLRQRARNRLPRQRDLRQDRCEFTAGAVLFLLMRQMLRQGHAAIGIFLIAFSHSDENSASR